MKFVILLLMAMALSAQADVRLVSRVDCCEGKNPFYSEAVIAPQGELWLYGNNRIEVGKLVPARVLGQKCLIGGYLTWRMETGKLYAEPYAVFSKRIGSLMLKVKPDVYFPLNGGKTSGWLDGFSVTMPIGSNIRVGPCITYWTDPVPINRYGGQIEIESKDISVYGRYLVGKEGTEARIQLSILL